MAKEITFLLRGASASVANAAFIVILCKGLDLQLPSDQRPSNIKYKHNYSTQMGITIRTDIFHNGAAMQIWKAMDNIQENDMVYAKDNSELKTEQTGEKSGEKRKEREGEKAEYMQSEKRTINVRSTGNEMSSKRPRLEDTKQTKSEELRKALNKADFRSTRYSNHMKDNVQSYCQICKVPQTFTNMRSHTKSRHGISITNYKKQYGQLIENIVETVYHKCVICNKDILLDGDTLATHAKGHGVTHKAYSEKYITLRTQDDNNKVVKMAIEGAPAKEISQTKVADVEKEYAEEDQSPVERYKGLSAQGLADMLIEELDTLMKRYTVT